MAESRITVKIEGLDALMAAIEELNKCNLKVEKIVESLSAAASAATRTRPRRLSDPEAD